MKNRTLSHKEWIEEAVRRFGDDPRNWRFVCPSCGHVATPADWKAAGAGEGEVAFSCVGRHLKNPTEMCVKPGPCNYAGGGLFRINPVTVTMDDGKKHDCFEFDLEDRYHGPDGL
jgi:hypothetical protein